MRAMASCLSTARTEAEAQTHAAEAEGGDSRSFPNYVSAWVSPSPRYRISCTVSVGRPTTARPPRTMIGRSIRMGCSAMTRTPRRPASCRRRPSAAYCGSPAATMSIDARRALHDPAQLSTESGSRRYSRTALRRRRRGRAPAQRGSYCSGGCGGRRQSCGKVLRPRSTRQRHVRMMSVHEGEVSELLRRRYELRLRRAQNTEPATAMPSMPRACAPRPRPSAAASSTTRRRTSGDTAFQQVEQNWPYRAGDDGDLARVRVMRSEINIRVDRRVVRGGMDLSSFRRSAKNGSLTPPQTPFARSFLRNFGEQWPAIGARSRSCSMRTVLIVPAGRRSRSLDVP